MDEFKAVIETYDPGIIAARERWFKSKSIFNISGYHVYRRDRNDGRVGGGVYLFIENSIDSFELNDPVFKLSKIEQVWSVVSFGTDKYLVGCIYMLDDFLDINDFEKVFTQARNNVDVKNFKDILTMDDYNFPSIHWSNGGVTAIQKENCIEEYLCDILNDDIFYQHVNIPTFQMSRVTTENPDKL